MSDEGMPHPVAPKDLAGKEHDRVFMLNHRWLERGKEHIITLSRRI